jgi:hypothetical protein
LRRRLLAVASPRLQKVLVPSWPAGDSAAFITDKIGRWRSWPDEFWRATTSSTTREGCAATWWCSSEAVRDRTRLTDAVAPDAEIAVMQALSGG